MSTRTHIRLRALLLEAGLFRLLGGMLLASSMAIAWHADCGFASSARIVEPVSNQVFSNPGRSSEVVSSGASSSRSDTPLTATDLLRSANDKGLREVIVTRMGGSGGNGDVNFRVVAIGAYENVRAWMALQLNEHASAAITRLALDGTPTEPGTVKVDLELQVFGAGADTPVAE